MPLEIGSTVHQYEIIALLGQGGMARVYRVRHRHLGTEVALKVLIDTDEEVRSRLLREGQVQARLRHLNLVTVTDVVEFEGQLGLIMEYVTGPSLEQLLAHGLGLAQADHLGACILAGVSHAHDQRMVHRDLKPGNILCAVEPQGLVPKVADFGLAKVLEGPMGMSSTRSGAILGTPQYMSPEQIQDAKRVDERTDVWALGVILHRMVTGQRPFLGKDVLQMMIAITQGDRIPLSASHPGLPPRMVRAIEGALTPDLDARIPNAGQLLATWWDRPVGAGGSATWGEPILEVPEAVRSAATRPQASSGIRSLAGVDETLPPLDLEDDSAE